MFTNTNNQKQGSARVPNASEKTSARVGHAPAKTSALKASTKASPLGTAKASAKRHVDEVGTELKLSESAAPASGLWRLSASARLGIFSVNPSIRPCVVKRALGAGC
jgi:hypothetical protein